MRLWLGILALSSIVLAAWNTSDDTSIWENYVEDSNYHEFMSTESERGLFPNIFNLATNSLITASSTCGQYATEEYCKIVEHVLLRKTTTNTQSPQCDICDANNVNKRHPIEYAIDGTRRWWQSPSLANGLEYEKVNITIDMRQEYQVAYVIVKMGNAPRPGTWALEKSLDGETFEPWQYFALQDAECMRQFGIAATTGVPRFKSDDEVHCTSEYSKVTPLENGEIHTSLVNGRPGAAHPSAALQKFTRARFVRLRMISPRTLNADLMVVNKKSLDKSVTMRYFYSISDISIGGQCICYGHAESCPSDPVTGQFKCECRHSTCGESCNRCCPLFNQLPWKPGNNSHPNVCQQCQCFNHAHACVYDEELDRNKWSITPEGVYEGGGRCLDCTHNTEGFNCERCKDGYYRPSGMSHYREDTCRICECDPVGSVSDACVRDDQSAENGQKPGDCICKPGFGGRRCERCAPGYRNHPTCEPCPCNRAGSVNFDTCDGASCQCKANVEGIYCDRCKAGTIHLSASNQLGCQACFCFGLTSNCTQADWNTAQITNNVGWNLTDLTGGKDVKPEVENGEVLMFNANQNQDRSLYYWKAPDSFKGNMLNSYGGYLHYYVYYVPTEQGAPVPVPDVSIEGNGIKVEYYSRIDFLPRENMTVSIPIREGNGWYNAATRNAVDKADLMRALANVETFLVRAMYQQLQLQSSIFGISLDTAVPAPDEIVLEEDAPLHTLIFHSQDTLMRGVEVCQCPENFGGNSCESCKKGYRRVNDQLYGGRCEKCNCEGHSDECDPFTGECLNCQHNTTGSRCEKCRPGYYGNPSLGGELGACWPCECPSLENNRSPECMMTELIVSGAAAANEDDYVCTTCERGYEGNKCEHCSDGFFGNPLNGTCEECTCNGNIDPMGIGNCDSETGKCLKCIGHTAGDSCDVCKENHWGNAQLHTCKPCGCHPQGAVNPQCNEENGECECKADYIGAQCDRCVENHGDVENGCPACDCNATGSIGADCDQVSGQCNCKQGVFGKQCDQCRPSYFNFSEAGCQFCHCNIYGSIEDGRCDQVTGKCECQENVEGTMCEKCADGYFNITSGNGCEDCSCDPTGSEDVSCNLVTGQCVCKPGVSGLKCDKCLPNFYGLTSEGCSECEACPAPGQVCDPVDGTCVCPPNTVGEMCENCTANAWDYHPLKGCKLCDCSQIGSDGGMCNTLTGQCKCKKAYVGLKCDLCTHGFFNFPTCEPCGCNVAGTDPLQCKDGQCLCSEEGECPCKKNVRGQKCDQCAEGTISLDASNVKGCTECFCFNRTSTCEQSNLVWQQMYSEDRRAAFQEPWEFYSKKHNINLLRAFPSHFNSYPTDATPLYWPLPATMLGDRTTSYNGFLRFRIWNEDNRRGLHGIRPDQQYFRYFPQVIIVGNNRIELEHIPQQINDDGVYKIRFHEFEWRARHSPELTLTRKQLMVALQNVQGIYVRGSYNYPARGDAINLQEVSLDVAVPESAIVAGLATTKAIGVEKCSGCPQGYSGLSCQNPDEGYCRKKHRDYLNQADDLALIGWSEPCACHGHSQTCNPDTCVCTDCEHNTFGDFCEHCLPGYIGDAREGGANACTKCACPLVENSFSDSCLAVDHGRGYVCNACKPGYTGQYCETCVAGYYGDPQHVGGTCAPCDCHPDGSLHGACNPLTGQCECKPGVTGRTCSMCQERHAFINRVCTSCDQGCYLPLMVSMDELEEHLGRQNFSGLKPIPWKRVWRIGNESHDLSQFIGGIGSEVVKDSKWTKDAFGLLDEVNFQMGRSNKSAVSVKQFTELAEKLILDAQIHYANAFNTTNFLKMFAEHGATTVGGAALDGMLMEAEAHYDATLERGEYIEKRLNRAQQEHKKAEDLLKMVTAQKLNETIFEDLKNRIDVLEQWMNDYRETIYDVAKKDTVDAERMSNVVAKRIDRYKEVSNEIEQLRVEAEDNIAFSRNAIEKARSEELMNMVEDMEQINITLTELPRLAQQCENITLLYSQLIDEYDEEYVQSSHRHATELEQQAQKIVDRFTDTRTETENPLKASHAYESIVEALKNATKAVESAAVASEAVAKMLGSEAGDPNEESLTSQLERLRNGSAVSEVDNSDAARIADELKKQKKELNGRVGNLNELKIDIVKRLGVIKHEASSWDDKHDRMHSVLKNGAKTAHDRAANVKKESEAIKTEVHAIKAEVEKLMNSTSSGVHEDMDKIRGSRAGMEYGAQRLSKVGKLSNTNQGRADKMARNIAYLKDKIEQAREKAFQIRLSLNSGERGLCKRTFISPAAPSPINTFHITYRPLQRVSDAVILVTKTKGRRTQASEYLAVEIKDQRVVVHWDIGSGKKMITNSHPINYVPSNDRVTWYHIDILRTGNALNLTVALKESYDGGFKPRGAPVSVFVGNPNDESSIFNTIPGETTVDLGTDEGTSADIGLVTHRFNGIVGGLRIDDVPLPLWSFESTTGECEGATAPPKTSQRGHLFRDGFANVSMPVTERTMSAITVIFRAFSPNGLLYFRGSERSGDFVAVYLNDGNVVFKINLGGRSAAELISQNTYNDGKEHTVKAIRSGSEMYLQVDSEADRFNTVITGENTALNIENEQHYVAGVPITLNKEIFQKHSINWSGFIGCILTVKPSQVGQLDLDHPDHSQGKSDGCAFAEDAAGTDRTIGFPKPGYLIAKGVSIDHKSSFAFSFRTREENGTLIYQSSKLQKVSKRDAENDGKGYMAFYLFRGYLVLHFGKDASSRKQVVTFRSSHPYNDGQVHAVLMTRNGQIISVKVDDKDIGETQVLSDESPVGMSSGRLILGGFSDDLKPPNNEIPLTSFFIGCISDVILNMKRVSLTPEKHSAQIGMCSRDEGHGLAPIDDPIDGNGHNGHRKSSKLSFQQTNKSYYEVSTQSSHLVMNPELVDEKEGVENTCENSLGSMQGAVRYGLSKSSHSRINFDAPYPNVTDFTVKLSLQTGASNGMIWAWANYKNYTRYIFLDIIDGFATLEVKGHKQPKILKHLGRRLNDKQWHDVIVEKKDGSLKLTVDSMVAVEMTDCPKPKVMKKRLYVGGVISKHRRQFGLKTPGLDGCIRDFEMNNKMYTNLDDPSTSKNVMQCAKACNLKRLSSHKNSKRKRNSRKNI